MSLEHIIVHLFYRLVESPKLGWEERLPQQTQHAFWEEEDQRKSFCWVPLRGWMVNISYLFLKLFCKVEFLPSFFRWGHWDMRDQGLVQTSYSKLTAKQARTHHQASASNPPHCHLSEGCLCEKKGMLFAFARLLAGEQKLHGKALSP